jgi:hypothetical protein
VLVAEGPLGGGHRLGIATEAVVKHRARPFGDRQPEAFPSPGHIPDGGLDQGRRLGLPAAQRSQGQRGIGRAAAPRRLGHRLYLIDQ